MKINKYLDRNEGKETFIVLYISVNGFNYRFSTGITIHPKHCKLIGKTRIDSIKSQCPDYQNISQSLENYERKIKEFIRIENADFELSKHELVQFISNIKGKGGNVKDLNFWAVYNLFIERRESGKEKQAGGKPFSKNIVQLYRDTLKKLKTFEGETGFEINFKSFITKELYTEFSGWLTEKDLHLNSRAIFLKTVKTLANWMLKNGYIKKFPTSEWESPMRKGEGFALTETDIELIKKVQLNEALNNTRNWFILQCFTGLRHSDLIKLKESDFDYENKQILVLTKKTGEILKIPILPPLEEFLKENPFDTLYKTVISRYNENLKVIAELAGFNEELLRVKYQSGVKKENRVAKSTLFGSHLARRSFITNSLRRGIPAELVRMISGHKSMASFQRYVKFTADDALRAFQDKY